MGIERGDPQPEFYRIEQRKEENRKKQDDFLEFIKNDPRFSDRARDELTYELSDSDYIDGSYSDHYAPWQYKTSEYAVIEHKDDIFLFPESNRHEAWVFTMGQPRDEKRQPGVLIEWRLDSTEKPTNEHDAEILDEVWKVHRDNIRAQWETGQKSK